MQDSNRLTSRNIIMDADHDKYVLFSYKITKIIDFFEARAVISLLSRLKVNLINFGSFEKPTKGKTKCKEQEAGRV